jgi:3-hydroxybenzoate/4-hydroxybenzoate---CoA ligase
VGTAKFWKEKMKADKTANDLQVSNAADEILGPTIARGRGGDIAILFGDAEITFNELNAEVNRFANALRPYLAKGDRALLLLKDSPVFVAAHLGIMRGGAVAVALSTRSTAKDLAFVMEDASPKVLLIDEEFLPLYHQAIASCAHVPTLVAVRGRAKGQAKEGLHAIKDLLADAAADFLSVPAAADDMAFWLYTSGTTGTPKAAIHCHGDVVIGDWYMQAFGFGPGERVFSSSKLFFAFALAHVLIGALRTGATIVLYEGWPDGHAIADVVERYRPTLMLSVPAFYRQLLRDDQVSRPGFKSVRCYLSAGEPLPESVYYLWREATGVPIVEGIGATETIFMMIGGTPEDHRPASTGKPLPYVEARLLDFTDQLVTHADSPGVLWVKMGSLCRGYWRQPDKTKTAFREGWFRTGDVFTVDSDGWWYHQGRADDLLKISGQWVSPAEIEECAAGVAGISEAIVVGAHDEDGLVRLTMFLVAPNGGDDSLQKKVQEKLLATLSRYKCPRRIVFLDSIPRTATGKARRFRLREWVAANFLARLLRAMQLDPIKIESTAPELVRDLQRKCVNCECQDRCAADLDLGASGTTFQDYCPNAEMLVSLRVNSSLN